MNRLVALTGVAGVGKSTLAAQLKLRGGFRVVDTALTIHQFLLEQDPIVDTEIDYGGEWEGGDRVAEYPYSGLVIRFPEDWDRLKRCQKNGAKFRELANRTSMALDRISPGLFQALTLRQAECDCCRGTPVVYCSVRNPDQWKSLCNYGSPRLLEVRRPGYIPELWPELVGAEVVYNSGSIQDLADAAEKILEEAK